jgi:glycosyltransferase involved in cell wall biosynthesis
LTNRIKVLEIISDTNFGGAGQYLKTLDSNIDRDVFDMIIVTPVESILHKHIKNSRLIQVPSIQDKSFSLKGTRALYKVIKDERPDIVHTHGSLSGRLAAQITRTKKVIYTKHTLSDNSNKYKRFIKKIMNKLVRSKVIAVSNAVVDNLIEEGVKETSIKRIYNGVEPSSVIPYDTEEGKVVISLVGRLEWIKGPDHMIRIAELLKNRSSIPFKILMVGEGSLKEELEETVKLKELPIDLLGHVDDIEWVYQKSDIIVNTSRSEALSFVALEAFAHGRPVVAFNLPGIKEVIADSIDGYLVKYEDYEAFTDRLMVLMASKEKRVRMGMNGRKKTRDHFTIHQMVKETEAFYREGL